MLNIESYNHDHGTNNWYEVPISNGPGFIFFTRYKSDSDRQNLFEKSNISGVHKRFSINKRYLGHP